MASTLTRLIFRISHFTEACASPTAALKIDRKPNKMKANICNYLNRLPQEEPRCNLCWEHKDPAINCDVPCLCHPVDMTRIPVCPQPPPQWSTKNPFCGCEEEDAPCIDYCMPGILETRILKPPKICVKPPCNYRIPAIPCHEEPKPKELPPDPLCFDWTVDEPGLNDSYGRGLNWYDWKMEGYNDIKKTTPRQATTKYHPGLSTVPPPPETPNFLCTQPIECFARAPSCNQLDKFATDVNYFRNWRCCEARPPPPWKPPYAQWATNQHL